MTRLATIREEVLHHCRKRPFESFAMNMENGDRIIIEHPENIALDPTEDGRDYFSVIAKKLRYSGPLSSVTSIATLDRGDVSR